MPTHHDSLLPEDFGIPDPGEHAGESPASAAERALDQTFPPEKLRAAYQHIRADPRRASRELLQLRHDCERAVQALEELEEAVKSVLKGNATLCYLKMLLPDTEGRPRAICSMGGALREIGVHPDVDLERLRSHRPWHLVMVNEDMIIGVRDEPELFFLAMGSVVEFKDYADQDRGLVRVAQAGHDESIVRLVEELRDQPLKVGARLILHRDSPSWAIASTSNESSESRFEVDLDHIAANLSDLAGIEAVVEQFVEDVLLRLVFTDIRDQFDLAPLQGALLYSYKPGMGKTQFMKAFAVWLRQFGDRVGFDVVLYHVKPNQLKSMWWGEDARIVREDLWGSLRARQAEPRTRPLIQLVVFDEIDSLQKRTGSERVTTSSHSDALEAMLVELEGLASEPQDPTAPVHVLCVGMTNRPDRIDDALKRPGRFGDLVAEMPAISQAAAEQILAVYARHSSLPWELDGVVRDDLSDDEIRTQFLAPAVAGTFATVVAHYTTDAHGTVDVTAGEIMAGVHYKHAMNRAKRAAARRKLDGIGTPAITAEDVIDSLLQSGLEMARQLEADPGMLHQQLRVRVPITRVWTVPESELELHRYVPGM